MKTLPLSDRISGRHVVDKVTGCWNWTGRKNHKGYGIFVTENAGKRRTVFAHRASFSVHVGPIPEGSFVCHRCDNRSCINPNHLHLGNPQSNMDEKMARRRGYWPGHKARRVGEENGRAKLTAEQVAQIRTSKEPRGLLACAFEVHPETITAIRTGRSRKYGR